MAACFLRADSQAICDCIKAFGLNDLLWDLTHCVNAFSEGAKRPGVPGLPVMFDGLAQG